MCAQNENEHSKMCACNGVAVFGLKFVSGKPGSGTKTTIEQLKKSDHLIKGVRHPAQPP